MTRLDNTTKATQTVEQKRNKNNNPKPLHVPREKQDTANDNHDEWSQSQSQTDKADAYRIFTRIKWWQEKLVWTGAEKESQAR